MVGEGNVEIQALQALSNLKAVVEAGGSELGKIVKTIVSPLPFFDMDHRRHEGIGVPQIDGRFCGRQCCLR